MNHKDPVVKSVAAKVIDLTIGRYHLVQPETHALPGFVALTTHQVEEVLAAFALGRFYVSEADPANAAINESAAPFDAAALSIEDTIKSLHEARASEAYLRSIAIRCLNDLSIKNLQIESLKGQVERRDKMCGDQRRAYLRELLALREIIRQMKHNGSSANHDIVMYQWDHDHVMEQQVNEQRAAIETALSEQREELLRERESIESHHQKLVDEMRKTISRLEVQLQDWTRPKSLADRFVATDFVDMRIRSTQTDRDDFRDLGSQESLEEIISTEALPHIRDFTITDDEAPVKYPSTTSVVEVAGTRSPRSSQHFASTIQREEFLGERSVTSEEHGATRNLGTSGPNETAFESRIFLSEPVEQAAGTDTVGKPHGSTASCADCLALRTEVVTLRCSIERLKEDSAKREQDLHKLGAQPRETDNVRRLKDEITSKDKLMMAKTEELKRLQIEVSKWFAQYEMSRRDNNNQIAVDPDSMARLNDAVAKAEGSESEYRELSWMVLMSVWRGNQTLSRCQKDCLEAERSGNITSRRHAQRALDVLESHFRLKLLLLRQKRARAREMANSNWDTVLMLARSLVKPEIPLPTKSYYTSGTVASDQSPQPPHRPSTAPQLALSRMRGLPTPGHQRARDPPRRREILAMMKHSRQAASHRWSEQSPTGAHSVLRPATAEGTIIPMTTQRLIGKHEIVSVRNSRVV